MRYTEDKINKLTYLFFTHNKSFKLLTLFSEIIIINYIYKIN